MRKNLSEQTEREFLIEILVELEGAKSFIYNGLECQAYRQIQKISDILKARVGKENLGEKEDDGKEEQSTEG